MALNKVLLIGNIGNDPEIRILQGGAKVASFNIATTERYKDRNGEVKENTEWHSCTAWDKKADIVEKYVSKGMQIYLEGKLTTRSWEDQGGVKRYKTEIQVINIQLLSRKEGNQASETPAAAALEKRHMEQESLDPNVHEDLPF